MLLPAFHQIIICLRTAWNAFMAPHLLSSGAKAKLQTEVNLLRFRKQNSFKIRLLFITYTVLFIQLYTCDARRPAQLHILEKKCCFFQEVIDHLWKNRKRVLKEVSPTGWCCAFKPFYSWKLGPTHPEPQRLTFNLISDNSWCKLLF